MKFKIRSKEKDHKSNRNDDELPSPEATVASAVEESTVVTPYQSYQDPLEQPQQQPQSSNQNQPDSPVNGHHDDDYVPHDNDQDQEDAEHLRRKHRGFSTSIADSFVWQDYERVDCCAMTCFGILQSDRDRYLLTGTMPPSLVRRLWIHSGFPLLIFLTAGYCAFTIPNAYWNQMVCTFLVTFIVVYMILQCFKGRWKRSRVRQELLWKLHQARRDHPQPDFEYTEMEDDGNPTGAQQQQPQVPSSSRDYMNGQTYYDVGCAHRLLGCYASDVPSHPETQEYNNFCACLWQVFQKSCCGKLCGCHLQLCGQCALAQEGRELERILPASMRRIDYITMQPVMEYYPRILQLRLDQNFGIKAHYQATSKLARILLLHTSAVLLAALILSLLPFLRNFGIRNFLVLLATIGQALVLLYVVYWHWHRFHLSLDAVIKYFASGFLLSSSLAITWELLCALVLRLLVEVGMALSGIDETDENGYGNSIMNHGEEVPLPEMGGRIRMDDNHGSNRFLQNDFASASVHDYMIELGRDYFLVYALFLIVQSFLMAAMIEELCKYFGYRMVDHADFLSTRELAKAADAPQYVIGNDDDDVETNAMDDAAQHVMTTVDDAVMSLASGDELHENNKMGLTELLSSTKGRSRRDMAAAHTIAMVATAIGFACCENLIYVFVYNGQSLQSQIMVLVSRALLPVHPIAAALQSIGVCRRVVEHDKTMRLGKMILPAVLFHGTFDYGLLMLDFWNGMGDKDAADSAAKEALVAGLSFCYALFCIMGALVYYYKQSIEQRQRLDALDQNDNSTQAAAAEVASVKSDDLARILS